MITKFSKYIKPEVGDYVAGYPVEFRHRDAFIEANSKNKWDEFVDFLNNNIGKIDFFYTSGGYGKVCMVKFDDNRVLTYVLSDVEYCSKNKEDVEEFLATKKYNL